MRCHTRRAAHVWPTSLPCGGVLGGAQELWAFSPHPSKLEYCTGAEDETLRVWDIERRQMRAMAKIEGPIRTCAYSPDGQWIAVGLGSGGKAKAPVPPKCEGKWIVLESEDLELKFAPPQVRQERCTDIKFAPDGRFVAVGNADNFIDIYTCAERRELAAIRRPVSVQPRLPAAPLLC
jgi:WD40 repeat protein